MIIITTMMKMIDSDYNNGDDDVMMTMTDGGW